jgi:hypothetical protein
LFLREEVIAADCDTGGDGALLSCIATTRLGGFPGRAAIIREATAA